MPIEVVDAASYGEGSILIRIPVDGAVVDEVPLNEFTAIMLAQFLQDGKLGQGFFHLQPRVENGKFLGMSVLAQKLTEEWQQAIKNGIVTGFKKYVEQRVTKLQQQWNNPDAKERDINRDTLKSQYNNFGVDLDELWQRDLIK